jgi:glutamine amidotransferase
MQLAPVSTPELLSPFSDTMIAIIDYKAGNLTSVRLAFDALDVPSVITRDPDVIRNAERVVFPGDGAAGSAMQTINELGFADVIHDVVDRKTPFLGICLGTQIIFERSEEDGGVDCIGLVPGVVRRFQSPDPLIKIPQMGWNTVNLVTDHPLFAGIEDESEFYFIHSYYPQPSVASHRLGETAYADDRFASIVGRANLVATQFHPERSGRVGLKLLENFTRWDGTC